MTSTPSTRRQLDGVDLVIKVALSPKNVHPTHSLPTHSLFDLSTGRGAREGSAAGGAKKRLERLWK